MAVVNGYCTVAEFREHSGDKVGVLVDGIIERAINASSRAIDKWCGFPYRKFWLDTTATARRYRPDDPEEAWVHDIGSTSGLIVRTDNDGDGVFETTWASTDYQLEPLDAETMGDAYAWWRILAIDRYNFPASSRRRPTLQVTAKAGWSAIPDDVNQACLLKAASLYERRNSVQGVAGFGEFGAVRITRADPHVIELLHDFRRVGLEAV